MFAEAGILLGCGELCQCSISWKLFIHRIGKLVIVFYRTVTTATSIAIAFSAATNGELLLSKYLTLY